MSKADDASLSEYLVKCMTQTMADAGIDVSLASSIAAQVEDEICRRYGCDRHYIPAPRKKARNERVLKLWRQGVSRSDIAKQCGVCSTTVDRVISDSLKKQSAGFGRAEWNL